MIYVGFSVSGGGLGGGGLADVTLTENRGDHVGVSRKPEPQKPVSPPTCSTSICLLMASVSVLS